MEAPLLEELKKLVSLQNVDSEIFKLEEELDILPDKNDALEDQIVEKENKIKELKNAIDIQVDEKEKRDEIYKKGEEKLKTITGKQSAIRNKEEYNALLREIDNIKRFNRDLSDEIAEINKEIEAKTEELNITEEQFSREIEGFKKQIEINSKRMDELDKTIDKLYDEREKLSKNIRPAVYNKYQRIIETSPNGKAIAMAEHRVCLGCNMTLPPELYNMVLRAVRIEVCPNCQCILIPGENHSKPASDKDEN
jgi:predicted  nucleic acid-binding Zn-ribbon protein